MPSLSPELLTLLRCPVCGADLNLPPDSIGCVNKTEKHTFAWLKDSPVLVDSSKSVLDIDEILKQYDHFINPIHSSRNSGGLLSGTKAKKMIHRFLPVLSNNLSAPQNYRLFAESVLRNKTSARILVIGGRILGYGLDEIIEHPQLEFVETDIAIGPRTQIICDAMALPFKNGSFDGVVIQAVLEHVADPQQCVDEIYRVLKDDGCVYAETPFIQQVHEGRFDFTRFTHRGHRRLFRWFDEIKSGAVCGPGMALAWSYRYFLISFTSSAILRSAISVFARCTAFWLKYLDYWLVRRPQAIDAASAVFFIGRKSRIELSDKEIIRLY